MKNLLLTAAFMFATVFSFASNEVKTEVENRDCWEETTVTDCGESTYWACSGEEHYDLGLLADFMCDEHGF